MDSAFGLGFDTVRAHTGSDVASRVAAQAFPEDVQVAAGEYRPDSRVGMWARAHELTYVAQRTGGESSVQRMSTSGMASTARTSAFAGTARQFWEAEANRDTPIVTFCEHLVERSGAPHPPAVGTAPGAGFHSFARRTWTLFVDPTIVTGQADAATVGQIGEDDAAELVDTIYHECRHSEQLFRIARLYARQMEPAAIAEKLTIPEVVAVAAYKRRDTLTDDPEEGSDPERAVRERETREWEAFFVGRFTEYEWAVMQLKDITKWVRAAFADDSRTVLIAENIRGVCDIAYRRFAEERDAFAVGGSAKQEFVSRGQPGAKAKEAPSGRVPPLKVETLSNEKRRAEMAARLVEPRDVLRRFESATSGDQIEEEVADSARQLGGWIGAILCENVTQESPDDSTEDSAGMRIVDELEIIKAKTARLLQSLGAGALSVDPNTFGAISLGVDTLNSLRSSPEVDPELSQLIRTIGTTFAVADGEIDENGQIRDRLVLTNALTRLRALANQV